MLTTHVTDLSYRIGDTSALLLKCRLCDQQCDRREDMLEHISVNHNSLTSAERLICRVEGCVFSTGEEIM